MDTAQASHSQSEYSNYAKDNTCEEVFPVEIMRKLVCSRDQVLTIRCTCKKYTRFWSDDIDSGKSDICPLFDDDGTCVGVSCRVDGAETLNVCWWYNRRLEMYAIWKIARENSLSNCAISWYNAINIPGEVTRIPPQRFDTIPVISAHSRSNDTIMCYTPPWNCEYNFNRCIGVGDGHLRVLFFYETLHVMDCCEIELAALNME